MILSEDFISELKSRNDIGEIIGEYVNLQQKGRNLMGLCPFHSERTPSFCVYPSNGSFYCFGCGAGGDVITFLRLIEHYDYIETVQKLAERAGMDFEISDEDNQGHQKKLLIYKINREAAKFYHKCLAENKENKALKYLKTRGVQNKTITHFGLGFSPPSGYALVDYFKKIGYNMEDVVLADLAFKSRSGRYVDRFRNRLMFPIIDVRGNVVAFGARTMGSDMPKYINTSDTPVFKKSSNLFALNFAKKSGKNNLILTEGYMDVITLHQAGFTNAVAGLGTALTTNQVKLIARNAEEVIVSYDSDQPGQKAAAKAIEMLKNNSVAVKVVTIPKAKDPDEYIRAQGEKGEIKFKNLIENSKSDIEYKLSGVKERYNLENDEEKVEYLTEAAKILASCNNSIEREVYAMRISSEVGISKSSVMIQIEKYLKQRKKKERKKEFKNVEKFTSALNDKINPDKRNNLRASVAEESLISSVVNNPDIAKSVFSKISANDLITSFNKRVFKVMEELALNDKSFDISNFSLYDFSFEEIGRITKMICGYNPQMGTKEAIDEYLKVIKEENTKNRFKDVTNNSEESIKEYIHSLKK